ncbi:MAG: ATP-binding protein [Cohaesibacter sp.]|jgi:nicotinamide riboside kinase|nr:ATP-binding protein [Cohaesibacter sp.]
MQTSLPRLILTGPESTGKSTLSAALAEQLGAVQVGEALRAYLAAKGSLDLSDAIPIARQQWEAEEKGAQEAAARAAPLICDTDLVSSLVYNAHYYADQSDSPDWAAWQKWAAMHVARLTRPPFSPRLYLLCGIDWPWVEDGQRDAPHNRPCMWQAFKEELERHALSFILLSGSLEERLAQVEKGLNLSLAEQ